MFEICKRLREAPELLALFFAEKSSSDDAGKHGGHNGGCGADATCSPASLHGPPVTSTAVPSDDPVAELEFPVFVYLSRFISSIGRTGDYARTALLQIFVVRLRVVHLDRQA